MPNLKFDPKVKNIIDNGAEIANKMGSEFYIVDHMFLALCEDEEFAGVLSDFSVNVEDYKAQIKEFIEINIDKVSHGAAPLALYF